MKQWLSSPCCLKIDAAIAQLVEHFIRNEKVVGSSPTRGSINTKQQKMLLFGWIEALGVMLEWLKRHAWKACSRQKRLGGSNPPHSAIKR